MSISFSINTTRLEKRLTRIGKRIDKAIPEMTRTAASRTAFFMMEYTIPVSDATNEWPIKPLLNRIEEDIQKGYPSKSDTGWEWPAAMLIEDNYNKEVADRFRHMVMSQDGGSFNPDRPDMLGPEQMIDKLRKIPRSISDKSLSNFKATSFGYRQRVYRAKSDVRPQALVLGSRREIQIRKKQRRAGLAKSAWWASIRPLYDRAPNKSKRFQWPREAVLIGNRNPSSGSGSVTYSKGTGHFEIASHLSYAQDACPKGLQSIALRQAQNAMRILMEQRFKKAKIYENERAAA